MNKQEKSKIHRFINDNEFLTRYVGGGAERELSVVDSNNLRHLMRRLNDHSETHKVKVPQFVGEWIEYVKKKGDSFHDSFKPWDLYGAEYHEADAWIARNEEKYARAWLDGYEVEEEPKYYIQLPETTWGTYLVKGEDNELFVWQNTTCGTSFTEQEIKAIDERYWSFAVPVKKV